MTTVYVPVSPGSGRTICQSRWPGDALESGEISLIQRSYSACRPARTRWVMKAVAPGSPELTNGSTRPSRRRSRPRQLARARLQGAAKAWSLRLDLKRRTVLLGCPGNDCQMRRHHRDKV